MAGIYPTSPWNVGPYSPQQFGQPTAFGQLSPFAPPQVYQLQQLLQIIPQQIQQLQQTIQFLPQHVAQVVVQTLIQSQGNIASFGQPSPFQSIPTTTQFSGQPGYVM